MSAPVALTPLALAPWLADHIEHRSPAAVVRFGDGEEDVLMAGSGDDASMKRAKWKLERQSGAQFTKDAVLRVGEALRLAFDKADVLGILFGNHPDEGKLNALTSLHLENVASKRREPAALASCYLHQEIVDHLPELLAGQRVSAVSSRDLKPVLEEEWELEAVAIYQVPSGCGERDLDGPYEAAMHDVPIWPDRLTDLRTELVVRERGEVFLVGAGIFGKGICIEIKEKGGLALDMGSALDRVVGKVSRGPLRRVRLLHDEGLSPAAIAAALEKRHNLEFDPRAIETLISEEPLHWTGDPHDWRTVSRILKRSASLGARRDQLDRELDDTLRAQRRLARRLDDLRRERAICTALIETEETEAAPTAGSRSFRYGHGLMRRLSRWLTRRPA